MMPGYLTPIPLWFDAETQSYQMLYVPEGYSGSYVAEGPDGVHSLLFINGEMITHEVKQ